MEHSQWYECNNMAAAKVTSGSPVRASHYFFHLSVPQLGTQTIHSFVASFSYPSIYPPTHLSLIHPFIYITIQ